MNRHNSYNYNKRRRARLQKKQEKKYVQFSKKVVILCVLNLFLIEFFSMWMIYRMGDTSQISYLITSIAVECLGCVIWYMKNSETEKKARISAEVEKIKLNSIEVSDCSDSDIDIQEIDLGSDDVMG